jgi:group I intron endonuclease
LSVCGIYQIINLINNKKYIGSSINIKRRKYEHYYKLNNNIHDNKHLQNAWNKYGIESFKFEVIEFLDNEEKLLDKEQFYIDLYKTNNTLNGYNIRPNASSNLGFHHSEETKQKFVNNSLGKQNNFYGKHHSEYTKSILSNLLCGEKNANAKLTEDNVLSIYKLLEDKELKMVEIANIFKVEPHTITQIKNGVIWKHLYYLYNKKDEINRNQKLTEDDVLKIYQLLKNNIPYKEIVQRFNISKQTISSIKNGINWKHLYHFYIDDCFDLQII